MSRKLFIAGNWKMNKTATEGAELAAALKDMVAGLGDKVDIAVCPTFAALDRVSGVVSGTNIALGAQNLSDQKSGAYTGEVAADMLLDLKVKYVIIGHSERRQFYGETDELVAKKAKLALESGLLPIICIGETLEEREGGKTADVITTQVKGSLEGLDAADIVKTTIAYEPIWAIGTGKTATPEQAQDTHKIIRDLLADKYSNEVAEKIIIQYGGSVKPDNSKELLSQADIDGALVGGASLDAETFSALIKNAVE